MSMRYPGGFIASTPVTAAYPSGVWTQAQAIPYQAQNVWTRDQFWPYTTLLLQGNGTNGAQNNTFLDSSSNAFTITRNGNTTQGSFTPYEQDGYWSNYFDGNGDYLSAASNAAFAPGTNDFTIECWVNLSSIGTYNGFFQNTNSTSSAISDKFFFAQYNNLLVLYTHSGGSAAASTPWTPSIGVWYHVAAVRQSGTIKLFINGVQQTVTGSTTFNGYSLGQAGISIGMTTTPFYFNGYISNLRYVVGTAVYTASFTLPTAPTATVANTQILTCQSNRFIDNSGNAYALTVNGDTSVQAFQPFPGATTYSGTVLGGSGYFDGSGDWLNLSGGSSTAIGTGSGTVEFWMYATANDGYRRIVTSTNAGFTSGTFVVRFNNGNFLVGVNGSEVTVSLPTANQWYHIAWVGTSGTSQTVYVNGVSAGTGGSYNATESINFVGGNYNSSSEFFAGYLAGVRVVKGTAVYTGAFTPPTSPPTAIANTSLLLNFTNAGISDAAVMNDLETVGNAQVSTSVVKYGTGSMAFDGNGDYLNLPSNTQLALGSGQFTVECWVYAVATTGSERTIVRWDAAAPITTLAFNSSAKIFWYNATEGTVLTSSTTINANTWYHIALVRDGTGTGQTKLYINGVLDATGTSSLNYTTSNLLVGNNSGNAYPLNGYIDDLRITKGAARYLTSFTPPPARMPGQ